MEFKFNNPFKKKEEDKNIVRDTRSKEEIKEQERKNKQFELENRSKLIEVFSFLIDIANDSIFERKKYHVQGTNPINLLEGIGKELEYGKPERKEKAQGELLDITQRMLEKAKSVEAPSQEIERIQRVIDCLQSPEIFSNSVVSGKIVRELGGFRIETQVVINRNEEKSKIIEKKDPWEKPDPSLN